MKESDPGDILKMISTIYRKTQMYLNTASKQLGISSGKAPFIIITCENGKMIQNKFCELLDLDKSTVAKMMGKLEQDGYIQRQTNPLDSRSIDVYPTEKAYEIYPKLAANGRTWAMQLTKNMTETERTVFFEMLEKADKNACEYF